MYHAFLTVLIASQLTQHFDQMAVARRLLVALDADCGDHEGLRKLVAVAPSLVREFEAIMTDSTSSSNHRAGLYEVMRAAKVNPKPFLKLALQDLAHADAAVRHCASDFARNAGGGPEFAAPLLMMVLHDPNASAAGAAMRALGKVGDEGTVVALEHLIRFGTGKQDSPEQAKAVAKAFGDKCDEIKARLAAAKPAPPKP